MTIYWVTNERYLTRGFNFEDEHVRQLKPLKIQLATLKLRGHAPLKLNHNNYNLTLQKKAKIRISQ